MNITVWAGIPESMSLSLKALNLASWVRELHITKFSKEAVDDEAKVEQIADRILYDNIEAFKELQNEKNLLKSKRSIPPVSY